MSSWPSTKYKTTNWSAYIEAWKRRGSLSIWFEPKMTWRRPPTGKRGRQPSFSDTAIQTCLTMKVLFGMPLRQTTGFVKSLLKLVGVDWTVPDFSTLCRRQRTPNVSIAYRGGAGPLNLPTPSRDIAAQCTAAQWTAPVSRRKVKASGMLASMAVRNGESGARYISTARQAIAAQTAAAVIPPRKNVKPWKPTSPGAVARNEALRDSK